MKTSSHYAARNLVLLLAVLVGLGAFLRYSDLSAPLLDFHPTRQLFSAIKARGIYYQGLPSAPAWQKDLAVRQYSGEAVIEPPVMELLAARLYTLYGEQTAIPRAISGTFWLVGGLFLFLLARNLTNSGPAGVASLAFYLLLPYAVNASRAFQPDPLMILLIILFLWSIERWSRRPTWGWTVLAGLAGGLAIFVKLPALFFIIGGALGAIQAQMGFLKALKLPKTWGLVLLGSLPAGAYLYYGLFVDGFLKQQFGSRFYPQLWVSPIFYLRWFLKLENVASTGWLFLAFLGCFVFATKPTKIFLGSLWAAYLVFGLGFAHHISSHDYYSLPVVPILALSLAPLTAELLPVFAQKLQKARILQSVVLSLLLISILLTSISQYLQQRTNDYRAQAAFWAQVGTAMGHQPGVLALTTDYGYPLAYYGWQNADPWPLAADIDNFDAVFNLRIRNKSYFLITDLGEYERQPELQKRLTLNYPVLVQGQGFIAFDLLHPKP